MIQACILHCKEFYQDGQTDLRRSIAIGLLPRVSELLDSEPLAGTLFTHHSTMCYVMFLLEIFVVCAQR